MLKCEPVRVVFPCGHCLIHCASSHSLSYPLCFISLIVLSIVLHLTHCLIHCASSHSLSYPLCFISLVRCSLKNASISSMIVGEHWSMNLYLGMCIESGEILKMKHFGFLELVGLNLVLYGYYPMHLNPKGCLW